MATRVDTHEVRRAQERLRRAPATYRERAADVMAGGARNIQRGMKIDASGHRYLPEFAGTVGRTKISALHWEIGFNRRGQGNLAHIIVFGSVNNAPVYDDTGPLHRETPNLERRLAAEAERVVADCFG